MANLQAGTLARPRDATGNRPLKLFLSAGVLVVIALMAVYGLFNAADARHADVGAALQAPGADHWLGTDGQGRDVFVRVCRGAGISILCALVAAGAGALGGLIIALASGLGPRWLDRVLVSIVDAVLAFPQLLLALAVSVALGAGLTSAIVGIVVTMVPVFARTLRSEALRARQEAFVEAAITMGLPSWRIGLRHLVPYLSTTLRVQFGANFGNAVLILAGLSFVGVGAQPPTPEWGAMISDGLQYALSGRWWIGVAPGAALLVLVVAVNALSDELRPRQK